jgi:hypothetical protein
MLTSSLQRKSNQYWQNAHTTYLAPAEYYDLQEAALRDLLDSMEHVIVSVT